MAAAVRRLLSLFETNATVITTTAAANRHLFRSIRFPTNRISSSILRFHRYSSSSASVTADETNFTASVGETTLHPWPEWVTFIDRLKSKGYIDRKAGTDVSVYKDMRVLKEACLGFGRDRFDLFKSLSMQDIQTLVEKGCPNTSRKAVSSGKRLRAHLQLNEEDVCGLCVFRGSCDRANEMLNGIESVARTVDVVRVLLNYAVDPAVDSDNKPAGAEVVEASAKKLLFELTKFSDTKAAPELQKPAITVARSSFKEWDSSRNAEMKRGDWMCPKCCFLNYSRNIQCRECNENRLQNAGFEDVEMRKGDWHCPRCNFLNFSRNSHCMKCETERPVTVGKDVKMKKGDWICTQCEFMNFASNQNCLSCRQERPKKQINPGEWECISCDYINFARNAVCRKCSGDRPKGAPKAKYQECIWRK